MVTMINRPRRTVLNLHLDLNIACLFESEHQRKALAFRQLAVEPDQHDVIGAGLERNSGSCRSGKPLRQWLHSDHALLVSLRGVQFNVLCTPGFDGDQTIIRVAAIGDVEIDRRRDPRRKRRPRPGVLNEQFVFRIFMREARDAGEGQSDRRQQ